MIRVFTNVERFVVGTVGVPGERTFFIQSRSSQDFISLSIEKMQVDALSQRLRYMVKEIRLSDPLVAVKRYEKDSKPLETPIEDEFRVGSIAIFFDESTGLIQVDLRELSQFIDDEDGDEDSLNSDISIARIFITLEQALAFADRADAVISAGRVDCPFCALPINPQGHLCARANGYRR